MAAWNPATPVPKRPWNEKSKRRPAGASRRGPLLDVWIYQPLPESLPERRVVIVTYGCTVLTPDAEPVVSYEHKQLALFTVDQIPDLRMPDGYKNSVTAWFGWK